MHAIDSSKNAVGVIEIRVKPSPDQGMPDLLDML